MWGIHIIILGIISQMIFLMMRISTDNAELYLCKAILSYVNLSTCSIDVKLTLFHTYCSPMYSVQLWWNYKKSTINRLHIAYHIFFISWFI